MLSDLCRSRIEKRIALREDAQDWIMTMNEHRETTQYWWNWRLERWAWMDRQYMQHVLRPEHYAEWNGFAHDITQIVEPRTNKDERILDIVLKSLINRKFITF